MLLIMDIRQREFYSFSTFLGKGTKSKIFALHLGIDL